MCHLHNERGVCLPDVSLYKRLCEILDITLNDFFAGEVILEDDYKEVANNNLLCALENSAFTLKDKVDFFRKKWEREHLFGIILNIIIVVILIIFGFIEDSGIQYVGMILGLIFGVIENNRKMAYIESHAYGQRPNITIDDFRGSIAKLRESKRVLSQFKTKRDAVSYLIRETGFSRYECSLAYDFIKKLN